VVTRETSDQNVKQHWAWLVLGWVNPGKDMGIEVSHCIDVVMMCDLSPYLAINIGIDMWNLTLS
jgi:hypothetical protein